MFKRVKDKESDETSDWTTDDADQLAFYEYHTDRNMINIVKSYEKNLSYVYRCFKDTCRVMRNLVCSPFSIYHNQAYISG
jgi:hypothetical protein